MMMEERMEDGLGDGVSVNHFPKRKFLSISSGYGTGNVDQEKTLKIVTGKASFLPQVENLHKGKFGGKGDSSVLKAKHFGGSCNFNTRVKPLQQNFELGIQPLSGETIDTSTLHKSIMPFFTHGVVVPESGNGLEDNKNMAGVSLSVGIGGESDEETDSDTTKTLNDSNAQGMEAADLDSNRSSSIGGSILSSGSKESELQKCAFLNYGSSSNASTGTDLLKTCSCSFCLKAAHIWSDLQYQDTKGRIAALKRSRKDVRSVIERSITYGGFGKTVLGNSNRPTKLEHDLMGQWRSLFLHTEDVLIRENSQLDSSLFNLKELRDYCKSNLATINVNSSNC